MTVTDIIAEFDKMGVTIACPGPERIQLIVDQGDVPKQAIELAREYKPELLRSLLARCDRHAYQENYLDEPDSSRPGWIRSSCGVCGRFIGYRNANGR